MSQKKLSSHGENQQGLLKRLKEAQNRFGYLAGDHLIEIAKSLDLPVSEVYGVATFYSFLSPKPQGKNVIRVCKSVPCYLKDSDAIIASIKKELGINPGETTPDGNFSFELTNCIGACDEAPAIMINHDVHHNVSTEEISQILKKYR